MSQTQNETPRFDELESQGQLTLHDVVDRLPNNFEVEEVPGGLQITEHWFRWSHALALSCVLASAFWAFYFEMYLHIGPNKIPEWAAYTFAGLLVAGTYWGVAGCVNTTTLVIRDDQFTRRVGPLPWWGTFDVPGSEVHQFFVIEILRSRKRQGFLDWEGDRTTPGRGGFSLKYSKTVSRFRLTVAFKDGTRRRISNEYEEAYTPRMVEFLVEAMLGIRDQWVKGEARV